MRILAVDTCFAAIDVGSNAMRLRDLLEAQKRTNRLLQSIIYGGLGFVLGLLVMQLMVRVRLF